MNTSGEIIKFFFILIATVAVLLPQDIIKSGFVLSICEEIDFI